MMLPMIFLFASLLLFSAFFSASETAVFSLDVLKRARISRSKSAASQRLTKMFHHPRSLLMSILIGNMLVNIALSSVAAEIFSGHRLLAIPIVTVLLLIIGEVTPKNIAYAFNERIALLNSSLLLVFSKIFTPIRLVLDAITRPLLSRSNLLVEKPVVLTIEEFRTAVLSGERAGILGADESGLIKNVLSFSLKEARHIMTPRTRVGALPVKTPLAEAVAFARKYGYSKIPLYKNTKDDIVGYLRVKDLLGYIRGVKKATGISHLVRPVYYIPEGKRISEFFMEFKLSTSRMAVVVDEFGGTAGIITLDDLLEEILGQFLDEDEKATQFYWRTPEQSLVFRGRTPLTVFNDELGLNIQSVDYETVSGYMLELAGDIPAEGAVYRDERCTYTIKKVQENYISEVEVKLNA